MSDDRNYPEPDDVIPFLEARYAEVEAAATELAPIWAPSAEAVLLDRPLTGIEVRHILLNGPDRALREVEGGRAIIAAFRDDHRGSPDSYDGFWAAILVNAYAFAGHPDYRPYWKLDWSAAF